LLSPLIPNCSNAFGLNFIKTKELSADYHRALISAERIRVKGDYDIEDMISVEDAQDQITWAERFIAIGNERLLN
jgi:uncharacterized protein (UPF0332 family)